MKIIIHALVVTVLLSASCSIDDERTDIEMFVEGYHVFANYLVDYGISKDLFCEPRIQRRNGVKIYTWIVEGTNEEPLGVEAVVSRSKRVEPELILIGDVSRWFPYLGSKYKTKKH